MGQELSIPEWQSAKTAVEACGLPEPGFIMLLRVGWPNYAFECIVVGSMNIDGNGSQMVVVRGTDLAKLRDRWNQVQDPTKPLQFGIDFIPTSPLWRGLAINGAFWLAIGLATLHVGVGHRALRRLLRRRGEGLCPACGYSLDGLRDAVCPECGGCVILKSE